MRVILFGGKWLGARMVESLCCPNVELFVIGANRSDLTAQAARKAGVAFLSKPDGIPIVESDIPWCPDLILSAHSFRRVSDWLTNRARHGAFGYHPSILPAFRGRRAVQDCIDEGVRITGGTVYHLTSTMDDGAAARVGGRLLQRRVQVLPNETALELWRRALAPLGVELLQACFNEAYNEAYKDYVKLRNLPS